MKLMDIIKARYSVRSYQDKDVERVKLLQVLEAGRLAPTAANFQPFHFIVITDAEEKQKVYEAYPSEWLKEAPVIIVACEDHNKSWKRNDGKDHADIDVAIAVDHMTLAAVEIGLGTCWVCAFDKKRCHELLQLPENLEAAVLLPLGYPKVQNPTAKNRKSLDELVSWEKY